MDCATCKRWMSSYVDEQLAADERTALDAHLGGCRRCQVELESLRQMLRLLRTIEPPETPELLPGIHEKLDREPWWHSTLSRFVMPWPASLPLHGLALVTTTVLIVIVVAVPRTLKHEVRESKLLQYASAPASEMAKRKQGLVGRKERKADKAPAAAPIFSEQSRSENIAQTLVADARSVSVDQAEPPKVEVSAGLARFEVQHADRLASLAQEETDEQPMRLASLDTMTNRLDQIIEKTEQFERRLNAIESEAESRVADVEDQPVKLGEFGSSGAEMSLAGAVVEGRRDVARQRLAANMKMSRAAKAEGGGTAMRFADDADLEEISEEDALSPVTQPVSVEPPKAPAEKPAAGLPRYYLTTTMGGQCDAPDAAAQRQALEAAGIAVSGAWAAISLRGGQLPDACLPDVPPGELGRFWGQHPWAANGMIPPGTMVCQACGCPQTHYTCVQSGASPEALREHGYVPVE